MIGSLVGAGLKIGGSIYGGIKASKAMKQVRKNIQEQQEQNEDWFNQRYNEDATQRADAQRLLRMTEDSIKNRNQQAAGAQAVMGGTDESTAAAKEANNEALSGVVSNINAAASSRKDNIEGQYRQRNAQLEQQLDNLAMQGAKNTMQAAQDVGNTSAALAGSFDGGDNLWNLARQANTNS